MLTFPPSPPLSARLTTVAWRWIALAALVAFWWWVAC